VGSSTVQQQQQLEAFYQAVDCLRGGGQPAYHH